MTTSQRQWYVATVINECRVRGAKALLLLENNYLVRAASFSAAERRALAVARRIVRETSDVTIPIEGKRMKQVVVGVSRVTTLECDVSDLRDGSEIGFQFIRVADRNDLNRLVNGGPVSVTLADAPGIPPEPRGRGGRARRRVTDER